ncbi:MAG: pyrimidine dimer DNA glycosylase/endonuclease V [candidate division WOR-3 bacterium]
MRLWSLHPKYLDAYGLLAVWREGLLAKKVLAGKTKAYQNHPQLVRFREYQNPQLAINAYLYQVFLEAQRRGYNFNLKKIELVELKRIIPITKGQVDFEFSHLLKKVKARDEDKYEELLKVKRIEVNPVFKLIRGKVADWEKLTPKDASYIVEESEEGNQNNNQITNEKYPLHLLF